MYRAEKSGFAREAQDKIKTKWDVAAATEAMAWVSSVTETPLPSGFQNGMDDTHAFLKSGHVLVKLANYAVPGSVKASALAKPQTMSFKQMEQIGIFLEVCKKHNLVKDAELFQTVDLFESGNMPNVIVTISALGRSLQKDGRGFGKAESVGEKKHWTDEQLKAGQSVIGLQMGTNKGASQAGLNMGKSRNIMD